MKRKNAAIMVVVITVTLLVALGCGEKEENAQELRTEQKTRRPAEIKQNIISYETLRQWDINADGVGMEILVSADATKIEVMTLARYLRGKYPSKRHEFLLVQIFDSKEAYLHRDDMGYPQDEYLKHFLVNIFRNQRKGIDDLKWVAKGRANKKIAADPRLKRIQTLLRKWGLATGPADGFLGEKTRRAIRNYQDLKGLPVTGEPSDELLEHIEVTVNASSK